jgi:FkbM family methyltransferase
MGELKTASVKIGKARFNISSDDLYLRQFRSGARNQIANAIRRVAGTDAFEPRMTRLFAHLIRPDDICLDVGANIGCTAILFAQLCKRVVSFEPTPKTFALWQRNVAQSGLRHIDGHNIALGNADHTATIYYSDDNRGGAFVGDVVDGGGESARIDVRRLDAVMPSLGIDRIDFMKIDVEGHEGKVIEGGWESISKFKPVIQLELNSWCLNAQQRIALPDFLDFLCERFPIIYGVERMEYADVRSKDGRWLVMRKNILEQRFKEVVVAFDASRLGAFHASYKQIV